MDGPRRRKSVYNNLALQRAEVSQQVIPMFGVLPTDKLAQLELYRKYDGDEDGALSFTEFCGMWLELQLPPRESAHVSAQRGRRGRRGRARARARPAARARRGRRRRRAAPPSPPAAPRSSRRAHLRRRRRARLGRRAPHLAVCAARLGGGRRRRGGHRRRRRDRRGDGGARRASVHARAADGAHLYEEQLQGLAISSTSTRRAPST